MASLDPSTALTEPGLAGGAARRRRAQGPKADQLHTLMEKLDPEVAAWTESFVFGKVWGRPGLSQDERMLVAIAALAATEHPAQLSNYLWGALHAGIPAAKIQETLVMLVVYVGFPAAVGALSLWRDIAEAARRQGLDLDG